MIPNSTGNRFARDEELAQLHDALTRPSNADKHGASNTDVDERAAANLLAALDASMLSPTVQRYVTELLIGGENPALSTRQKLVEAANRGLRNRRVNRAALPALLAFKREEAKISVAELAGVLQVPVEDIYRMESGRLNVRQLNAERIAKWVLTVRVDPAVAVRALEHVLALSAASQSRPAAGRRRSSPLSESDRKLMNKVAALLG